MTLLLDRELSAVYARVLVAIARADHEINFEEGLRLAQIINARCQDPLELEDLLYAPAISAEDLAALVGGGPFRSFSVHPGELAKALVTDGVALVLAKGHVAETEARSMWRYASALGLSAEDFRTLTSAVSPWFPAV